MKKVLATLLALCMAVSMLVAVPVTAATVGANDATAGYQEPQATVTASSPNAVDVETLWAAGTAIPTDASKNYVISSAKGLCILAYWVQNGAGSVGWFSGYKFYVTAPLDMSTVSEDADAFISACATDFPGIAYHTGRLFNGTFNGQGNAISNLKMVVNASTDTTSASPVQCVGLFGFINGATIENVVLDDTCSITASYAVRSVGSIVGLSHSGAKSTISNCKSAMNITYNNATITQGVGGIIGGNQYTDISGCTYSGTLSAQCQNVGGISGQNVKTAASQTTPYQLTSCVNTGNITCEKTGNAYVGGIIGNAYNTTVSNCINKGVVTGYASIGGIVGFSNDKTLGISNCSNLGAVNSASGSVGGIGGYIDVSTCPTIENCENLADVSGVGNGVGGICGTVAKATNIQGCINKAKIEGTTAISGIVGLAAGTSHTIANCINYGLLIGEDIGDGILGKNNDPATVQIDSTTSKEYSESTQWVGYQTRTEAGKTDLRLVGSIDTLKYNSVGFRVDVSYMDGETLVTKTIDKPLTKVYSELLADGENVEVPAYRGADAMLFALVIKDLPTNVELTFTVQTYSVLTQGATPADGESAEFKVTLN